MNRRTFLKVCAASALSLAACTTRPIEDESDKSNKNTNGSIPTVDSTEEEEPEIVADYGLAYMPEGGVHPYVSTNVTNLPIQSLMYEQLFIVNRSFEPEAVLCKSYTVSSDHKEWHFEIYHNITFSDGSKMTANDVITSWAKAEKCGLYDARFRFVMSYKVEDDYHVVVKCGIPVEDVATILDLPIVKADTMDDNIPLGSGPFCMNGLHMVRNTHWWQKDTTEPGIEAETIRLVPLSDIQDIRDEFQFGDVDVVYTDPYNSSVAAFQGDNEPWGINTTEMQYLGFNLYGVYCASASVRSAFTYLVDRATIIADIYGGAGLAATLPCNPAASIYDTALASEYTYDIETFKAKITASGFKPDPGNPMRFVICSSNTRRLAAAQMIVKALNDCRFYTELIPYKKSSDFLYIISKGEFDVLLSEVRIPPNFDLAAFFGHNRYPSVGGTSSDTNKQLMNAAMENHGSYYDLWRSIMNRGVICPIMFKVNTLYTTRGTLKHTYPSISNLLQGNGLKKMDEILYEPSDDDGDNND